MTSPLAEERILGLTEQDAKAALLLLARELPYEVGNAIDRITRHGPEAPRRRPEGQRPMF
jgi:hypothetical protein